jgi:hypothetical protein
MSSVVHLSLCCIGSHSSASVKEESGDDVFGQVDVRDVRDVNGRE